MSAGMDVWIGQSESTARWSLVSLCVCKTPTCRRRRASPSPRGVAIHRMDHIPAAQTYKTSQLAVAYLLWAIRNGELSRPLG